jgi:hypothetical protein
VDHDREIADSWPPVYDALRNAYECLGLATEDRVYHRQGEPHGGGAPASCYGHEHTMIVFDASKMDRDPREADFHRVIDTHLKHCEGAERAGHRYETSIDLDPVGEDGVANVAQYMAKYITHSEEDHLARSTEHQAWGAVQWATNTKTAERSDNANHAIDADRCRQAAADPDRPQVLDHGDEVRRRVRNGGGAEIVEYVCNYCGSPWGIDQEKTLAAHRMALPADQDPQLVADGGEVLVDGELHPPPDAGVDHIIAGSSEPPPWRAGPGAKSTPPPSAEGSGRANRSTSTARSADD